MLDVFQTLRYAKKFKLDAKKRYRREPQRRREGNCVDAMWRRRVEARKKKTSVRAGELESVRKKSVDAYLPRRVEAMTKPRMHE